MTANSAETSQIHHGRGQNGTAIRALAVHIL
jgi:hypothetical protein